jgi:hypothetical protein
MYNFGFRGCAASNTGFSNVSSNIELAIFNKNVYWEFLLLTIYIPKISFNIILFFSHYSLKWIEFHDDFNQNFIGIILSRNACYISDTFELS